MSTPAKISFTVTVAARAAISFALSSCPGICPSAKVSLTSSSKALFQPTLPPCSSKPPLSINSNSIATPRHCAIWSNEDCAIPLLIKELRIGYAPGGSLRRHLAAQGYSCDLLKRLGLLNPQGCDAFYRRVIFPCCQGGGIVNFYGRSIAAAFAHQFLPGSKGGLFAWELVRQFPTVILVEGLFDFAVLWQAGFRQATCSLGTHLNADQFQQLCERPRTVYLTFDVDANGSGQQASQQLAQRLCAQGIATRRVLLPDGHDPNSFFVQGGDARQFHSLLEVAQP